MFYMSYTSWGGGVNNVAVAVDGTTGEFSCSLVDMKHAVRALKAKLARRRKNATYATM